MYKLIISLVIIIFNITFIVSCTPVNLSKPNDNKQFNKENNNTKAENISDLKKDEKLEKNNNESLLKKSIDQKINLNREVVLLFPKEKKTKITNQFINIIELAIYNKGLRDVSFRITYFENTDELEKIIINTKQSGRIYIGPLEANNTKKIKKFCNFDIIFFSFSSDSNLANDCVFLLNFFPKNELEQLFKYLKEGTKVALLYPENEYGYLINSLIDEVINNSDAILVNRSSYKQDLSNVRNSIKELGQYELRKYELKRQKQILINKNDDKSKRRLKKLEKFKTISDYNFTHVLIADYGLNLLQVAPLLTYYDIDPNIVQFMGTGVMDDENFFYEPSLQGAIFPGVEKKTRQDLLQNYSKIYNDKFIRISTLPYDLIGLLNYVFTQNIEFNELNNLLKKSKVKFDGVDGSFYFKNNIIERELNILKIKNGKAFSLN